MAKRITEWSVELVKEATKEYQINENKANTPENAVEIANAVLKMDRLPHEVVAILTVNAKLVVTGVVRVSLGAMNSTIITPVQIFQPAMLKNAHGIIILHNHPSGDPTPSIQDREMSDRMVEAGRLLGIQVLDSIVIGHGDYTSLKKIGMIE